MTPGIQPVRLRLSRTRGFNLQTHSRFVNGLAAVKVDRSTKWGNPFVVGKPGGAYAAKVVDRRHAFMLFRSVAPEIPTLVKAARLELLGRNLACWCPCDDSYEDCCHGTVLLALANREANHDR